MFSLLDLDARGKLKKNKSKQLINNFTVWATTKKKKKKKSHDLEKDPCAAK